MAKEFTHFKTSLIEAINNKDKIVQYNKKVLIIGYGGVGECMCHLLIKHVVQSPTQITIVEKENKTDRFEERNGDNGVKFVKREVVRGNLEQTLKRYTERGGLVVDCSLNIGAEDIVRWCMENGVLYTNTSLERWKDQPDETIPDLADRTLYHMHQVMRSMAAEFIDASTAVVTNGANPGLVTQFTKRALLHLADKYNDGYEAPQDREGWATLMRDVGVKVIHISERDTQITDVPKVIGEFVGTWSPEGFWAEARAPAELGWGTHEGDELEDGVIQGSAAYLNQPGVSVLIKSWVPGGPYNGYCIQHSESITISDFFTTQDGMYRPSVYYVYMPCNETIASVHELRGRELDLQKKHRLIKDEIVAGRDVLGILLIGDSFKLWHGSLLDINEARELVPGENATELQVCACMLAGVCWVIENPNEGYTEPEELPYDYILKIADPYLGPLIFEYTDWEPTEDRTSLFKVPLDEENPCAFKNFKVTT